MSLKGDGKVWRCNILKGKLVENELDFRSIGQAFESINSNCIKENGAGNAKIQAKIEISKLRKLLKLTDQEVIEIFID